MPAACSALTMPRNSCTCWPRRPSRGVAVVRGEEADRVVAPVVAQAAGRPAGGRARTGAPASARSRSRRAACRCSMIAGWAMPAYVPRSSSGMSGWPHGQALHVRLVDDRVVVRDARRPVVAPVEVRVDHHRTWACTAPSRRRTSGPGRRGRSRRRAGSQSTSPSTAFAYGSSSSLCGLQRSPRRGSYAAVHPVAVPLARARRPAGSACQTNASTSRSATLGSVPLSSNRQSSTGSATSEKMAKLVPIPS